MSCIPGEKEMAPNNRLQGTGTLKVGQASKVLFRSAVLRKRSPVPEPGVMPGKTDGGFSIFESGAALSDTCSRRSMQRNENLHKVASAFDDAFVARRISSCRGNVKKTRLVVLFST